MNMHVEATRSFSPSARNYSEPPKTFISARAALTGAHFNMYSGSSDSFCESADRAYAVVRSWHVGGIPCTRNNISQATNLLVLIPASLPPGETFRRFEADLNESPRTLLREVRQLTGFAWERVAELLGVDRRSLTNWMNGGEIRTSNQTKIRNLATIIRHVDRGNSERTAAALLDTTHGKLSAFSLIKIGRFSEAALVAGAGEGWDAKLRRRTAIDANDRAFDQHRFMTVHEGAILTDEVDSSASTPVDKMPPSRKRSVKRS